MSQASILTRITEQRRLRIQAMANQPAFEQQRLFNHIKQHKRPTRSLEQALRHSDKGFILECKKASPSKGLIREQFDPVDIARTYQSHAAAISVLTEPDHFAGDFAYLQAVSSHVQIPVLCKDFIVEPLHVYLAAYYGADAILLMLSVLDDPQYQMLAALAAKLELEVLTEVSNEQEMRRAGQLGARIIGINHRNLHDLSIDLSRSEQLAALAPANAVLVAESGITNNQQVRHIGRFVDGFLVGSHLTAQDNIDAACRALIYGPHKVCGLTSGAAALQARSAGAVYGGLIFAERSPRCVSNAQARAITEQVNGLQFVAVTTATEPSEIQRQIQGLPLSAVQLHGQQSYPLVRQLRADLPTHTELWYALNMADTNDTLSETLSALVAAGIDKVVLDQGNGGSGQSFDWSVLKHLSNEHRARCIIAGGLNANNIVEAASLGCFGLDMNSGVESSPGQKDPAKVTQVFTLLARYYRDAYPASPISEEIAS